MTNLTEHARHELHLAHMFGKESSYGGMIGDDVMQLVELFASQGHSGGSAAITLQLFCLVANFKPLTELTDANDEWNDVSEMSRRPMWQSRRRPDAFSMDAGRTYYLVDKPEETFGTVPSKS